MILLNTIAKNDDLVKSPTNVIPAVGACPALDTGAGIYNYLKTLDSRLRGNDKKS